MKSPDDRLAELFADLSHRDAAGRSRMLDELREMQPDLADELESLLSAHDTAGRFLDHLDHDRAAGLLRFSERLDMPEFAGPFRLLSEFDRGSLGVVYLVECGVAFRRDLFAAVSDSVADVLFSQGIFLLGQDLPANAESAFHEVMAATNAAPSTRAHGWRHLGRALRAQGRYAEALEALSAAESAYREIGGQSAILQAHRAAADRGYALMLDGQPEPALDVLEAAVIGIESIRGETHYDLIQPLGYLGLSLRSAGREKSEAVLQRAAAVSEAVLGAEHRFTREARSRLEFQDIQL